MSLIMWWAVLALVWVASLTTLSWQELAAAAIAAALCTLLADRARRVLAGRYRLRAVWLRGLRVLPWAVLTETVAVWRAAARSARHRRVPGGLREVPLGHERSRPRQAIAVLLLGASPGSVVVDVDRRANVVRLHSIADDQPPLDRGTADDQPPLDRGISEDQPPLERAVRS